MVRQFSIPDLFCRKCSVMLQTEDEKTHPDYDQQQVRKPVCHVTVLAFSGMAGLMQERTPRF